MSEYVEITYIILVLYKTVVIVCCILRELHSPDNADNVCQPHLHIILYGRNILFLVLFVIKNHTLFP